MNFVSINLESAISYPVSKLSQFSAHPTKGASRALSRVLSYLRCNTDFGITGRMHNGVDDIQCFSDSDLAGDLRFDTRSQTGIMIMLNDAPVYWRSVKQPRTTISVACAEIYALSDCVKHARLLRWRAQELGVALPLPLAVQVDNSQAKSFAEGTCVHSKLRGTFDVRAGWVEELRKDGEVMVKKIATEDNFADLLTKTHSTAAFQRMIGRIGSIKVKRQQRAMLLTIMAA